MDDGAMQIRCYLNTTGITRSLVTIYIVAIEYEQSMKWI